MILFSAVVLGQVFTPTRLEKLLGITVASAHSLPSDWWSVPLAGGKATQLTQIMGIGLYASVSPDQRYIVSYSGNGIFVMQKDGTGLTMLVNDLGGVPGTVSWIP